MGLFVSLVVLAFMVSMVELARGDTSPFVYVVALATGMIGIAVVFWFLAGWLEG